jgi:ABC-2 type transport system ATP-binding protein
MIQLQNITKTYSKGNKKAVDDLTLHVAGGELFGFIGPNGAGKTTTIKLMTGILSPDQGSVTIAGHRMDQDRLAAQRLIGFVPDGNDLYDRLTGMEYLNFMADVYQVDASHRKAHIEKYLNIFSLEDAINNQIRSYSKGMKQKLVVIGALIHNPPVWILDEPLGGLDPRAAHLLKEEMMRHCREGNTVFFSTHVLEVAEKLCTRIGIIAEGSLKALGTLDELRSGEVGASLEDLFLELTDTDGETDGGEDK